MNVTDFQEIWQIDAGGQFYEARFEEMAQWIYEGSLLPQDLVRRGNLRWIEARKVPGLLKVFNAKEQGLPPPVFTSTTDAQQTFAGNQTAQTQNFAPPPQTVASNPYQTNIASATANDYPPAQNPFEATQPAQNFQNQTAWNEPQSSQAYYEPQTAHQDQQFSTDFCAMHPDVETAFLCTTCGNGFCKACPKSYGGSVKICPFCGAMCKSVKEVVERVNAADQFHTDLSKGFGIEDFFNALGYPFKYGSSLVFGAIMFALFTLGQSASGIGNIFLMGAALVCWMLSNMLSFGVLTNVVDNFAQGRVGGNFMPSFDDFSIWDDVLHPFFLFLATYIVSFGLLVLFIAGIVYYSWTTFNGKQPLSFEDKIKVSQYEKEKREGRFYNSDPNQTAPLDADEENLQDLQKELQNQRQKELESVAGKTREQEESDKREMLNNFLQIGLVAVIGTLVLLLWGIFYYPAACLVAGYTRSFIATLNPAIGLETIKLLGWDYVKLWLMCLAIGVVMGIIGVILELVFSAFHLPGMGNLPAKAVGGLFMFYFSVVYAVILGFALYKNSDKLRLFKG